MIDALRPYPRMKDSGVAWLGEVPAHWETRKLRNVLRRVTERNRSDLPLLSVVREKGVILRDTTNTDENHNFVPEDLSSYKVVRAGQLAMNKMKAWQGSYGVSQHNGTVSPAYFVFDVTGVEGQFFHTAIRSRAYVPSFAQASDGVRIGQWDLAERRMREISFLVPPLHEQAGIVRFLDHADRQIRQNIRVKQKLIKLLEEQKRGIIHHAVTRGLDPNVRLKSSGVEWLGGLPEKWKVSRLGELCSYISYGFTNPMPGADDGPFMLTANDIGDGAIRYDTARRTTQNAYDYQLTRKSRPIRGDVLVTKDGTLGRVAVADGRAACINQSVALLRIDPSQLLPEYLSIALRGPLYQERMLFDAGGTTIRHIYITRLAKMPIAVPPIPEQEAILKSLRAGLSGVGDASLKATREITLLQEYRVRLISDVVIGKLDTREVAGRLPVVTEHADELDETGALRTCEEVAETDEMEAGAEEAQD